MRKRYLNLYRSAGVGLALLLLLSGCRQETHEERRWRMWKEDFKVCDRFAHDRNKARELLAYKPEEELKNFLENRPSQQVKDVLAGIPEVMRLWKEDREACLRGRQWTNESIAELTEKSRKEADERARTGTWPWQR